MNPGPDHGVAGYAYKKGGGRVPHQIFVQVQGPLHKIFRRRREPRNNPAHEQGPSARHRGVGLVYSFNLHTAQYIPSRPYPQKSVRTQWGAFSLWSQGTVLCIGKGSLNVRVNRINRGSLRCVLWGGCICEDYLFSPRELISVSRFPSNTRL